MSWDVSIFASKVPPPPVAKMNTSEWMPQDLGSAEEVRRKISASLPQVDWTDPTWGAYRGDGLSFEFNIGRDESVKSFMIHVRGGGDAVSPLIQLAERWTWYVLDCSEGQWVHHCSQPDGGWQGFQAYRDRVFRQFESAD